MKVVLNKSQLAHISKLIEKKGVNYYDVNMEMTDHVGSEVEEMMLVEQRDFLMALKQVFLKYDRFHFMRIEEEQQKKLQKQSWKLFWRGFLQFFTIPKIIATITIFMFYVNIVGLVNKNVIISGMALCVFTSIITLIVKKYRWLGKEKYLQLASLSAYLSIAMSPFYGVITEIEFENFSFFVESTKEISTLKLYIISGVLTFATLMNIVGYEIANNELLRLKKKYA